MDNVEPVSMVESSQLRDQVLNEIRSGRRLEKIVGSIESFLNHQIEKLEQAVAECEAAAENDRIVKEILKRHEEEKKLWEEERQAETLRLSHAGEELIKAWDKLEDERRHWLDSRQ